MAEDEKEVISSTLLIICVRILRDLKLLAGCPGALLIKQERDYVHCTQGVSGGAAQGAQTGNQGSKPGGYTRVDNMSFLETTFVHVWHRHDCCFRLSVLFGTEVWRLVKT